MDNQEYFENNALIITEIISPTTSLESPDREVVTSHNSGIEVLFISIVSIIGLYFLFKFSRSKQNKSDNSSINIFQKFAPPSCKKCRFFNNDSHLKCAVHPVRVNNVKAKDCSDYWQRDRRKFFHR